MLAIEPDVTPVRRADQAVDIALGSAANVAAIYGGQVGWRAAHRLHLYRAERSVYAVWVVAIVAIAAVGALGVVAYVATVCINRGGSFDGGLSVQTNGWKVWEYKLRFRCTQ